MKTSKVVNLKQIHLFNFSVKNKLLILFIALFVLGVGLGTFSLTESDRLLSLTNDFLKHYIDKRESSSFFSVFFSSSFFSLIILCIPFIFGVSLMGIVLVPISSALCGFFYGAVSSLLYSQYALKGIAFNALVLIPSLLVLFITFIYSCKQSIAFSGCLIRLSLPKSRPESIYIYFKDYCAKYVIYIFLALVSSAINSVCSCLFMKFFDF